MPRPRTVDDAAIGMALGRAITKVGPAKLTLVLIAREAGLAPATLIQRFGSKRNLLVKLSKGAGDARPLVEGLRQAGKSALAIIRELLLCCAEMAPNPTAMRHSFSALLEIDLTDPVLRGYLVKYGRSNERLLAQLIEQANAAGELRCPDPAGVARVLFSVASGSLLGWVVYRRGSARDWLAKDIKTVLAPYLEGTA